ncbi:uridine diphosphate glucose pyrophosphatase NUDT14-like isoform X2 [Pectinophora gossypiella]|uniref:uridine diphosphate glucose pyrophosphatase NUDT14-like isoform X2 n=1 Tax=Pectinophora gossypiella TaxID=13191 RepID=UPI00214F50BC|nr:uridine diphosphate glucose pyrophosphatase NUDT14-like isoform X2 [Pectinophora gossypiella]
MIATTSVNDGVKKTWDLLEVHDSVSVVLFNITRRKLIFVKQFRPAVYFNSIDLDDRDAEFMDTEKYPPSLGITLEMCAGIVDKEITLEEIAVEEVMEECGYNIETKMLERIISYRAGVGVQGSAQTLYYCEVTDEMRVTTGGGVDDEMIEVVELSIPQVESMVAAPERQPVPTPPSCLFGLMWFLLHKADKWRKTFENYCDDCKNKDEEKKEFVAVVHEEH